MKHKYTIEVNEEKNELVIKEYGELDKEILSLLCEERYIWDELAAKGSHKTALIDQLRTPNLYPPENYIHRIADTIMVIIADKTLQAEPQELHFDDLEQLSRDEAAMLVGDIDEEAEDLDDLLEDDVDDVDDGLGDKLKIKSIKIAEDDDGEGGDDS